MSRGAFLLLALGACADAAHRRELAVEEPQQAPGEPSRRATPEEIEAQTRLGLQVLHARALERQLGHGARLVVPDLPQTIGTVVPVQVELANRIGEEVELFRSPEGLAIEVAWSVERWLPYGSRDRQSFQRVARLTGDVLLPAGSTWSESTVLPLEMEGEAGALWDIRLSARLYCDGARLGERTLPVKDVHFQEARVLAFPDGWQPLAANPLASLRAAIAYPGLDADRHLLVCAALLPPARRRAAIAALIEALPAPASRNRAATLTATLSWLTGQRFGAAPAAWTAWWEGQEAAESARGAQS